MRVGKSVGVLEADVLVVGGGPAGAWAAFAAAARGARVILADKGFCGTSGATAPSNTGTWCVPPGENRAAAVEARFQRTHGLADRRVMLRAVDQTYENLLRLVEWGYPFPRADDGSLYIANLRGPDYMRFLRTQILKAGVRILDHHPVLELLSDGDTIVGARGLSRASGEDFAVHAGATVLATGGCAFFERIMGATGLTGDGLLMAAEAGAALSGMEFTGKYTLAPAETSLNKGLPFRWASFYAADGTPLVGKNGEPLSNGIGAAEAEVARFLVDGPVYARLDLADDPLQDWLRRGQPNCFLPYDRLGIDPFRDLFPVTLRAEGTVRGTGGIRVAGEDCRTDVPGLFVAGDAASREDMAGAVSGGGSANSCWAMASGYWAGRGAATFGRRAGRERPARPLGGIGLNPAAGTRPLDLHGAVAAVRAEVVPLAKNYFRTGAQLANSRTVLEGLWRDLADHLGGEGIGRLKAREVAAVASAARWSVSAALARDESRGIHRRTDRPDKSPSARRILVSGLADVVVGPVETERLEALA